MGLYLFKIDTKSSLRNFVLNSETLFSTRCVDVVMMKQMTLNLVLIAKKTFFRSCKNMKINKQKVCSRDTVLSSANLFTHYFENWA